MLGLILVIAARDGASAQDRAVFGAGMTSCGQWQEYRTRENKAMSYHIQAWIAGYLSGYNVAADDPDFLIGKPDPVAMYTWIDNYCRDKPLDFIVQAANMLRKELLARAR